MSKRWVESTRKQAFFLLGLEFLFLLVIAFLLLLIQGWLVSYSLILGGLVSIIPNLYFTYQLFKKTHASQAKAIVRTFYKSEFFKLILMAILFLLVVRWAQVSIVPFVAGFFIAQMGVWFAPLLLFKGKG